ncbi:MAG: exodeoxyribonuclease VII large subunit [Sedimentisphaerales bacterium]|nr:exodeoxyribonuclease VII large subunit [Sedimentisphaerales bacterium]
MVQSNFLFDDSGEGPRKFSRSADFFSSKGPTSAEPGAKKPVADESEVGVAADKVVEGAAEAVDDEAVEAEVKSSTIKGKLPKIFTVTQITRLIKMTLNRYLPAKITVEAEVSNCKRHSSGHIYLALKDDNAVLGGVMWKSAAAKLKFQVADGMSVVATGRIDLYEPQGKYQFYIDKLEPAGLGALELARKQLAEKLQKEGLFDRARKKPLPVFPRTIAIVTSGTGAAIKDIVQTLNRRFGIVRKLLMPVAVQGAAAAGEIARALNYLDKNRERLGGIDLIILGRGGGSIEDLWAFNEEVVARAIFSCRIPIITGIGHEIDTSIADLVADVRAATPTAAAEIAVPVLDELVEEVVELKRRLDYNLRQRQQESRGGLDNLMGRPCFARPMDVVRHRQQLLDERSADISRRFSEMLRVTSGRMDNYVGILRRIEPGQALGRARNQLSEHLHLLQRSLDDYRRSQGHLLEKFSLQLISAGPQRRLGVDSTLIDNLVQRSRQAERHLLAHENYKLDSITKRLENLNPRAVLGRGYSITRSGKSGSIISAGSSVEIGEVLRTELAGETFIDSKVISRSDSKKVEEHESNSGKGKDIHG